jgi:hypothetical protein
MDFRYKVPAKSTENTEYCFIRSLRRVQEAFGSIDLLLLVFTLNSSNAEIKNNILSVEQ